MRRSHAAIAVATLAASTLAFAPSIGQVAPQTDHAIVFTQDGTQSIEGAADSAGTNLGELATGCSRDPDTYCETVHVTVEQPVADADPDAVEFGLGEASFELAPTVPGMDFDVNVVETDAEGTARGAEVASSGNFPACAQVCDVLNMNPLIDFGGCGSEHDECGGWAISTNDLGGTRHYLIEVVYYAAAGGYTLDVSYERTDGAGSTDGTDGADGSDDGASGAAAADSAERVDVTGGFEPTGDWGGGGDSAALGDALGQDIEAAFVEYGDDVFTFTIDVTSLPAAGGTPEATRYVWDLTYNGTPFQLDGKFTNYSRGACDPTAGGCPPPRDPGIGFFALRGNCVTEGSVTTCEELAALTASFDPSDGTIAVPVSADLLAPDGVAACDAVGEGVVAAQISAFFSLSTAPQDTAGAYFPLVVPHADPALSC